eukprot:5324531-Alexandrium_andersonii.AAC.1
MSAWCVCGVRPVCLVRASLCPRGASCLRARSTLPPRDAANAQRWPFLRSRLVTDSEEPLRCPAAWSQNPYNMLIEHLGHESAWGFE